jgi:hypothetical protein
MAAMGWSDTRTSRQSSSQTSPTSEEARSKDAAGSHPVASLLANFHWYTSSQIAGNALIGICRPSRLDSGPKASYCGGVSTRKEGLAYLDASSPDVVQSPWPTTRTRRPQFGRMGHRLVVSSEAAGWGAIPRSEGEPSQRRAWHPPQ